MVLKPAKRGARVTAEEDHTVVAADVKPVVVNGSSEPHSGIDSATLRYAFLSLGIWISFTVFGYCQESLTRQEFNGRRFVWTEALIVCQCISNVIVSGTVIAFTRTPSSKSNNRWTADVPTRDWFVVALGYLGAHSFGLAALKHIIFPLQVIIKSCKSIPVMIGEILIAHHPPSLAKTFNVIQLSGGVALFMYAKAASSSAGKGLTWDSEMLFGAFLACMALVCDAIYGPYQNRICKTHNPSNWVLMFNMNFFELVVALGMAVYNNEIIP
ncbi:UDP-galactose transporter, putative, partial [Perkinsus marinus ATCC 50983]